jgi:hypothetical protein|tara:strand:+ start:190 stop:588 length:399 start_codon:yes stop_codon:yes gene_type:complete
MNTIIKSNKQKMIAIGENKLKNNEFLQDLSILMENEAFKTFYKKHMTNWIDVKCSAIYMKLYTEFKDKYEDITNEELDKNLLIFLLCKIMNDKTLRPFSIKAIDLIYENGKGNFFEEFEKYVKNNTDILVLN